MTNVRAKPFGRRLATAVLPIVLASILVLTFAPHDARAWQIANYVMCKQVDAAGLPADETTVFLPTDEQAVLWVNITEIPRSLPVRWEWYEPGGTLFADTTFTIPAPPAGKYWTFYSVYGYLKIKGTDASEKTGQWQVKFYVEGTVQLTVPFVIGAQAELELVGKTVLPEPGKPVYPGDAITIKTVLKNVGTATARTVRVVMENLSPSDGIAVVESSPARDLEPGQTADWTIILKASKPGEYRGVLRIYMAGQMVTEEDWSFLISVPKIELVSKIISPEEGKPVYPGDIITATYGLRNAGESIARQVELKVETLIPDGLTVTEVTGPRDLDPGGTGQWVVKLRAEREGEFSAIIAVYASGAKLTEGKITVSVSAKPFWQSPLLLGGVAVVIVALLVILTLLTRRRKAPPEPTPLPSPPPAPTATSTGARYCTSCGAEVAAGVAYCPTCGSKQ